MFVCASPPSPLTHFGHRCKLSLGDRLQDTATNSQGRVDPTQARAELPPGPCGLVHGGAGRRPARGVGWSPQEHGRLCQPWGPPSLGALTHFHPVTPSLLGTSSLACPLREEGHGKGAWNSLPGSGGLPATAPAEEPHLIRLKPLPFTELEINHFTELENKSLKFQNQMAAPIGRDGYCKPALLVIKLPAPTRSGCTSLTSLNACDPVHPPVTDKETGTGKMQKLPRHTPQNLQLPLGRAATVLSTRPLGQLKCPFHLALDHPCMRNPEPAGPCPSPPCRMQASAGPSPLLSPEKHTSDFRRGGQGKQDGHYYIHFADTSTREHGGQLLGLSIGQGSQPQQRIQKPEGLATLGKQPTLLPSLWERDGGLGPRGRQHSGILTASSPPPTARKSWGDWGALNGRRGQGGGLLGGCSP